MLETLEDRTVMAGLTATADGPITIYENAAKTIFVLANDTTTNPGPLTIVSFTQGDHGAILQIIGNALTYIPDPNSVATDIFQYTVTDGTDTLTASVYVNTPTAAPSLLSTYLSYVSAADATYADDVNAAAATRDTAIVDARAAAQSAGDQYYTDYQSTASGAEQTYDGAVGSAEDGYTTALATADAAWQNDVHAAVTTRDAAIATAEDAYAATVADLHQDYEDALDAAQSTYDSTVGPYQSARDNAYAYFQANPTDPAAEAAYNQAQSDLDDAIESATTEQESANAMALSTLESGQDQAAQDLAGAEDMAFTSYQTSMADANDARSQAEEMAWTSYVMAKDTADATYVNGEDQAWSMYVNGVDMLESDLASTEAGIQDELATAVASALTNWQNAEQTAWDSYLMDMANIPATPEAGDRALAPRPVQVASTTPFAGIDTFSRQEPVLFAQERPGGGALSGPAVVPGNSNYSFWIALPAGADPASGQAQLLTAAGGAAIAPNVAAITWTGWWGNGGSNGVGFEVNFFNTSATVFLSYTIVINGVRSAPFVLSVDIVQVTVGTPANAFQDAGGGEVLGNPFTVNSFSSRFNYSANVTLTAPNNADLAAIKVGFVQLVTVTNLNAAYVRNSSANPFADMFYVDGSGVPLEGRTFLDSKSDGRQPWVIASTVQPGAFANTNANQNGQAQTIGWHDAPKSYARRTFLARHPGDWLPSKYGLLGLNAIDNFQLKVVASLASPAPADRSFWSEGGVSWASNLSFSYVPSGFSGTITLDNNFGLTLPNAWTIPAAPEQVQTNQSIAADAINAGGWRVRF